MLLNYNKFCFVIPQITDLIKKSFQIFLETLIVINFSTIGRFFAYSAQPNIVFIWKYKLPKLLM